MTQPPANGDQDEPGQDGDAPWRWDPDERPDTGDEPEPPTLRFDAPAADEGVEDAPSTPPALSFEPATQAVPPPPPYEPATQITPTPPPPSYELPPPLPPPGAPGGPREHGVRPAGSEPRSFGPPPPPPAMPPPPPSRPPHWEAPAPPPAQRYPMDFEVQYPPRLSRWKTFLRGFLILPAAIFAWMVSALVQASFPLGWVPVFVKRKYPDWLFAANGGAMAYQARFAAYGLLLTDRYPSFSREDHPVRLEYADPPQGQLSRWRVFFWKLLLIVPHLFVLWFLYLAVGVVTFIAWFAILFTGNYPRGLFGFVTGVLRWTYRVQGYFASFNDRFPPFSLSAEAGPGGKAGAIISGAIGMLFIGSCGSIFVAAVATMNDTHDASISYAALSDGRGGQTFYTGERFDPTFVVTIELVTDPADELLGLIDVPGHRVVVFEWTLENANGTDEDIDRGIAHFTVADNDDTRTYDAAIVVVNGQPAPAEIEDGEEVTMQAAFVVPEDAEPVSLRLDPPWPDLSGIRYEFR